MVGKQCEPPGTGHSVNQEFRQRLLQQCIMRGRISARCGKIRKKAPPANSQERIGGEAAPEEKATLPARPQDKRQYSPKHEIPELLRFIGDFRLCVPARSAGCSAFCRCGDQFVLNHVLNPTTMVAANHLRRNYQDRAKKPWSFAGCSRVSYVHRLPLPAADVQSACRSMR